MSVIEQGKDYIRKWTEQERLEWIKAYQGIVVETPNSRVPEFTIESGEDKYDMVAKMIDSKKKCCDNCDYKLIYDKGNITMCKQQVSNSLNSDIVNSDTFYCSYHKLRLNNE